MVSPVSNSSPTVLAAAVASGLSSGAAGPSDETETPPGLSRSQGPRDGRAASPRGFEELRASLCSRVAPPVPSTPARTCGEDVRALLLMARMGGRADRVANGLSHRGGPAVAVSKGAPRERIAAALATIAFHAPAGAARVAQAAMEAEYIDWAAKVLQARENAFGSRGYALGHHHGVHDPAPVGGLAGGSTANAVDTVLLSAMDRRARLVGFAEFKPVDLKALVPEPAPVQLRLVQGNKEYWRPQREESAAQRAAGPGGRDMPAGAPLTGKTENRRKPLLGLQDLPSVAAHLVAGPWRDSAARVPSREAVQARIDDVARSLVSKVFASVLSTTTGPLTAQIQRHGAAAPGESPRSGAYMLQQAAQGATNDFVWQASKEAFKGSAYDLGMSLDRWRDNKQAQWLHAAHAAQRELAELATGLQRAALPQGSTSPANAALAALRGLAGDSKVRVEVVQAALATLKAEPLLAGADAQLYAGVVQRAEAVIHSMAQCGELKRWRDPLATQETDRSR